MIETLDNEQFLEILKQCCNDDGVDDEMLNNILCNYFPYNLCFHGDDYELPE